MALEAGDGSIARAHLSPARRGSRRAADRPPYARGRAGAGEGDEDARRAALDAVEPLVAESAEPQWIGAARRAARPSCAAASGELDGARAAVAEALDRLELCTDDVMRIARRERGRDRASRRTSPSAARDLRERGEVRDALARARIHVDRLRGRGAGGRPGRAGLAGRRARPSWPAPGAGADPRLEWAGGRARGSASSGPTRRRWRAGARPRARWWPGDRDAAARAPARRWQWPSGSARGGWPVSCGH